MAKRSIRGSRAIVTGASSGIGRELALELARQGARLVLVARRAANLEQLVAKIAALGGQAEYVAGDITSAETRQACVARAQECFAGLDMLINNAGVGAHGPFDAASPERLRRIMEVNFFAPAEMIRAAIPLLRSGTRPLIVNVGSILGHQALPGSSEYCASKFALRGLTQSLRAELAPSGIDLLLVSPATTASEFTEHLLERQGEAAWRASHPTPADVVARRIVRAMRQGRRELFPSFSARAVHWLQRLSPSLLDRIVRRRQ